MPLINTADRHAVTVKTVTIGESTKGTPFIQLDFENAEGDSISGWLYLSESAFKNSLNNLREVFKFDGDFENLTPIVGQACSIVTEFEEWEGKPKLKVKWINSTKAPVKAPSGGVSFIKQLSQQAARTPVEDRAKAKPTATKAPHAPKVDADGFPLAPGKNPY